MLTVVFAPWHWRLKATFCPRECLFRVAIAAPVFLPTNCLCRNGGREKGQLPGGFAGQAWGSSSGTIRQFSLRMAFSLRSLGVVGFTLQAFSAFSSAA